MIKRIICLLLAVSIVLLFGCKKSQTEQNENVTYTLLSSQVSSMQPDCSITRSGDFLYCSDMEYDLKNKKSIKIGGDNLSFCNIYEGKMYGTLFTGDGVNKWATQIIRKAVDTGKSNVIYENSGNEPQYINQLEMAEDGTIFFLEGSGEFDYKKSNTFYMINCDGNNKTKLADRVDKYYISGNGFYSSLLFRFSD